MANNENNSASYMTRRIGGTTYKVRVCFSETAQETLEDKILRMIRNETVTNADGTQSVVSTQQEMPKGSDGFLQKLITGEATLYATFENGSVGVTLALLANGDDKTYIVVDYKNLSAGRKEMEELYDAL